MLNAVDWLKSTFHSFTQETTLPLQNWVPGPLRSKWEAVLKTQDSSYSTTLVTLVTHRRKSLSFVTPVQVNRVLSPYYVPLLSQGSCKSNIV